MTRCNGRLSFDGSEEKCRILRARSLFEDLAGRIRDPDQARRLEAELNNAWLQLQFALVTGNAEVEQSRRRACLDLIAEARQAARGGRDPAPC